MWKQLFQKLFRKKNKEESKEVLEQVEISEEADVLKEERERQQKELEERQAQKEHELAVKEGRICRQCGKELPKSAVKISKKVVYTAALSGSVDSTTSYTEVIKSFVCPYCGNKWKVRNKEKKS